MTTVLFIGQGLALLAIFTMSVISSITGTMLAGSLGSGELMVRVGIASATTISMGLALIILAASFARMFVRESILSTPDNR